MAANVKVRASVLALVLAVVGGTQGACHRGNPDRTIKIAVNQFVVHPNLDAVLSGFKTVVEPWAAGRDLRLAMDVKVANADFSIASQIAKQQAAEEPALILALATPSAQAALRASKNIPVVFGAITDPVGAGLVKSLANPGGLATGTSDIGPYSKQFELIRRLLPTAATVGIIRNPGEANSVASMTLIDRALEQAGFRKVEVAVASPSDVRLAASSLVGKCDLLYTPADNTVLSALDAVVGIARAEKLPLFVGDEGSVKLGGVATIGIDYFELGKDTGRVAIRILEGAKPGEIPVVFGKADVVFVNSRAAEQQGLKLPVEVLAIARDLSP